jgi:hypothetical protein
LVVCWLAPPLPTTAGSVFIFTIKSLILRLEERNSPRVPFPAADGRKQIGDQSFCYWLVAMETPRLSQSLYTQRERERAKHVVDRYSSSSIKMGSKGWRGGILVVETITRILNNGYV